MPAYLGSEIVTSGRGCAFSMAWSGVARSLLGQLCRIPANDIGAGCGTGCETPYSSARRGAGEGDLGGKAAGEGVVDAACDSSNPGCRRFESSRAHPLWPANTQLQALPALIARTGCESASSAIRDVGDGQPTRRQVARRRSGRGHKHQDPPTKATSVSTSARATVLCKFGRVNAEVIDSFYAELRRCRDQLQRPATHRAPHRPTARLRRPLRGTSAEAWRRRQGRSLVAAALVAAAWWRAAWWRAAWWRAAWWRAAWWRAAWWRGQPGGGQPGGGQPGGGQPGGGQPGGGGRPATR